ncbi:MAG: carboxypeptidase regulatory-like domain-containing protein [Planctomycetota bacterium]|nr:MAG: carboxypeptidase regulatory-like domain-containing protein [Planctomycetota bacterium]
MGWLWIANGDQNQPTAAAVEPSAVPGEPTRHAAHLERLGALDERAQRPVGARLGVEPAAALERQPMAAQRPARDLVTLHARFVRPDGSKQNVTAGRIALRDEFDVLREVEVRQTEGVRVTGLAPGRYAVHFEGPELHHREQYLELGRAAAADRSGAAEVVCVERLMLWPANWVAVVVETVDGRPLAEVAERWGHDPAALFVGAFELRARLEPPREAGAPRAAARAADDPTLARFHLPRGYRSWELQQHCVGSLEVIHPPPLWIGLDVLGAPAGWELLQPGATELRFRVEPAALEQRLARVCLRIVDADSSAPVDRARVTLRADRTAHRRTDLTDRESNRDGRVVFADLVPGRYELTVTRGESQLQQSIELAASEQRDLGDLAVGEAVGVEVLVLAADGRPVIAYVEIGAYEQHRRSGELFPRLLQHRTDARGRVRVPRPGQRAIVRATRESGRSDGVGSAQELGGSRSPNVLLDPAAPQQEPLRLELHDPLAVEITTRRAGGACIEVLDALDVVVARSARFDVHEIEVELVPGHYRARCVTPNGARGSEWPFVVDRARQCVAID